MSRDFQINGESLVRVQGNGSILSPGIKELGLAEGPIVVSPKFSHRDIHCDDYGPDIPAEVMWLLAEVTITMDLIHFDETILTGCIDSSMAAEAASQGTLQGAGTTMGQGQAVLATGTNAANRFITLNILSPVDNRPWTFPATYIAENFDYPLGTGCTVSQLKWRAIPFKKPPTGPDQELVSTGAVLWTRTNPT